MNRKIIVSRFKEDYSWIDRYKDNFDYLIMNKGEPIEDSHILNVPNRGGNQRDIFEFVYNNYDNLPDIMIFVQGFPFDHCNEEKFKKVIYNNEFTCLESYEHLKDGGIFKKDSDGGYMEQNNNWYIGAVNQTYNTTCKYSSYDEFMGSIFKNYNHVEWIRFSPGSQYLITKEQALSYSNKFWYYLMNELPRNFMSEGHIIERACWYILKHVFEERDILK